MDADVVSLEEVENSTKIGDADRDDAVIRLSSSSTRTGRPRTRRT